MTRRPAPDDFRDATWEQILPRYEDLAARSLTPGDDAAIESWLADWSALESALGEAATLARIAYGADTGNPEKEAANRRFSSEIGPRADEQGVRLANKLLDTGYARDDLATTLRRFRTDRDIFREVNVPLQEQLQDTNAQYQKLTGGMTAEWDGQEIPLPRLAPYLQSPDRAVRERAFRLGFAPYIAEHDVLAELFDQQLALRQQVARNAGFANYRDYVFEAKHRYDYTPADCAAFHDAVAETFVPALRNRREERRRQMGLDTLKPWDTEPDPLGRPALTPYQTIDDLTGGASKVFARVDPTLGGYFGTMRDESLLDLESRRGKRPGGFCATLSYRQRPFIFMNAAGVARDVRTLLHESGHAFHSFEASALPFVFQRHPGSEMAEVASMSMELLAAPYLPASDGGFYDGADYARARVEHLEGIVALLPWVATVDAFQQWLYTDPAGADRDARDAKWIEIWSRFDPVVDWTGAEAERVARWYKQLHIFLYPFYYIEYGIAQLGALQVWRNSLQDQARAVADYRAALALGGSRPLPELFRVAGARLIFDQQGLAELAALIEDQIVAFAAGERTSG
jgi:oligoendopeptidase F